MRTDDPVIVVSPPRSGSSWLARTLASLHPRIRVHGHTRGDTYVLYSLSPFASLNPWSDDGPAIDRWSGRAFARLRSAWLRSRYHARSPEDQLVLATPITSSYLPRLALAFTNARYIHLRRDPLDVVASLSRVMEQRAADGMRASYRRGLRDSSSYAIRIALGVAFHQVRWWRCSHPGFLFVRPAGFQRAIKLPRLAFLCWYYAAVEAEIRSSLDRIPEGRRFSCCYEDLVSGSNEILRLAQFLRVEPVEGFLEEYRASIRKDGVGRHREVFSTAEIAQVSRTLAQWSEGGVIPAYS